MCTVRTVVQSLVLGFWLAVGFLVVWGCVTGWFGGSVLGAFTIRAQETLVFLNDGTPAIYSTSGDNDVGTLKTLADEPLDAARARQEQYPFVYLMVETPEFSGRTQLGWGSRMQLFADATLPPVIWYFLRDSQFEGHARFVGFDSRTNARVGFIGTAGFRAESLPDEERFVIEGVNTHIAGRQATYDYSYPRWPTPGYGGMNSTDVYLQSPDKVYLVDLAKRSVSVVFAKPPTLLRSIGFASEQPLRSQDGVSYPVFRTDDQVFVLRDRAKPPQEFTLPADLRGRDLYWGLLGDGGLAHASDNSEKEEPREQIYWFDAAGHVTRTAIVRLHNPPSGLSQALLFAAIVPCPLPDDLGLVLAPMENPRFQGASYGERFVKQLREVWPTLVAVHALAALLAIVCYRHASRYARPRGERIAWTLFVLLLGLPGFVAYLTWRHWPPRKPCPRCGAIVPRDREYCAVCQQEFPLPEPRGIEIFA